MRELLLGDDALKALRNRPDIVAEFPFVRYALPAGKACRPCQGRAGISAEEAQGAQQLKTALLGLPADKKKRFLELLGADKIHFYVRTGQGVTRQTLSA